MDAELEKVYFKMVIAIAVIILSTAFGLIWSLIDNGDYPLGISVAGLTLASTYVLLRELLDLRKRYL